MEEKNLKSSEEGMEIDLLKLAKHLWKKAWLIVIVGLVVGGLVLGFTELFVTPKYQSTAKMYVNNTGSSGTTTDTPISGSNLTAAQSLTKTYIQILFSRSTLEKVINDAELVDAQGNPMSYERLSGMISAGALNGTEIFQISVTDTDPERAKKIANTIVTDLPYQIQSIVVGSSVKVVDFADVGVKTAPSKSKNTLIGFLIGALIVCAIEVIRFLLDHAIHDEETLMKEFNLPLLAVVPDLTGKSGGRYGKNSYKSYGYKKSGNKYSGARSNGHFR